ncbi:hypothetical protein CNMCM5793_007392 [Aspergillus hiratsukae]|uniref:Uncharacterized protein n=1 Tax=Aspergillus hiratsukae TaxID=1194566 RepID=A0A8H6UKE0_9EURO|nr:hypothetical protein CNMCM5793_007392 [Aspergillus hiratsukae]
MSNSPQVWLRFEASPFAVAVFGCVLIFAIIRSAVGKEILRHMSRGRLPICPHCGGHTLAPRGSSSSARTSDQGHNEDAAKGEKQE